MDTDGRKIARIVRWNIIYLIIELKCFAVYRSEKPSYIFNSVEFGTQFLWYVNIVFLCSCRHFCYRNSTADAERNQAPHAGFGSLELDASSSLNNTAYDDSLTPPYCAKWPSVYALRCVSTYRYFSCVTRGRSLYMLCVRISIHTNNNELLRIDKTFQIFQFECKKWPHSVRASSCGTVRSKMRWAHQLVHSASFNR